MIRYDAAANRFENFKQINEHITALYADRAGKIWIGAPNELFYLDTDSNRLASYKNDDGFKGVSAICEDRAGNLWLGTLGGEVGKMDGVSGQITRIRYKSKSSIGLTNYRVLAIFEDSLTTAPL